LSIGGNDVRQHAAMLQGEVGEGLQLLDLLIGIADDFAESYEAVAKSVAAKAARTVLCTIYEVKFEPAAIARLARAPLDMLNDRICRVAVRLGLEVLDLRTVCTLPADFVLQIEPSAQGAEKIASAISLLVQDPVPLS